MVIFSVCVDGIDADRSGTLDRTEICRLLQTLGKELTDAQISTAMTTMDKDK